MKTFFIFLIFLISLGIDNSSAINDDLGNLPNLNSNGAVDITMVSK